MENSKMGKKMEKENYMTYLQDHYYMKENLRMEY